MQIWSYWLNILQDALQLFATTFGLSMGAAILLLTLALRLALLPVSWSSAYRNCIHQKKVRKLQPELQRLREHHKDNPNVLAEQTLNLYRKRGVSFVELHALLGTLIQMPVFLGMFQVLRGGVEAVRFMWISSLSKPDIWMAILAGITTAMMMAANPDIPEQTRILMIALPSIVAFVFALKFSSALALYWVASNLFTAAQTFAVHFIVGRRVRNGIVAI